MPKQPPAYRRPISVLFNRMDEDEKRAYVEGLHARYQREYLSLAALAVLAHTTPVTLMRLFQRYNLPRRPPHTMVRPRSCSGCARRLSSTAPLTRRDDRWLCARCAADDPAAAASA